MDHIKTPPQKVQKYPQKFTLYEIFSFLGNFFVNFWGGWGRISWEKNGQNFLFFEGILI
jgi:hypothetical protein